MSVIEISWGEETIVAIAAGCRSYLNQELKCCYMRQRFVDGCCY